MLRQSTQQSSSCTSPSQFRVLAVFVISLTLILYCAERAVQSEQWPLSIGLIGNQLPAATRISDKFGAPHTGGQHGVQYRRRRAVPTYPPMSPSPTYPPVAKSRSKSRQRRLHKYLPEGLLSYTSIALPSGCWMLGTTFPAYLFLAVAIVLLFSVPAVNYEVLRAAGPKSSNVEHFVDDRALVTSEEACSIC
jgi:hypothetical protein